MNLFLERVNIAGKRFSVVRLRSPIMREHSGSKFFVNSENARRCLCFGAVLILIIYNRVLVASSHSVSH